MKKLVWSRQPKQLALALGGAGGGLGAVAALTWALWPSGNPGEDRVRSAWEDVQDHPHTADRWTELGDAQTSFDQLTAAEISYQTALQLGDQDPLIKARYGFLLYAQGRDDEALPLLEQALNAKLKLPMLRWTVSRLRKRSADAAQEDPAGDAAGRRGPKRARSAAIVDNAAKAGRRHRKRRATTAKSQPAAPNPEKKRCELRLERTTPSAPFRIQVAVNGEPIWLIVDTGASITAIAEDVLERVGAEIFEDQTIAATTATGLARFSTAVVSNVELAGRTINKRRVAVCNACGGDEAAGLLGLDFQAALNIRLLLHEQKITFADCAPAQHTPPP